MCPDKSLLSAWYDGEVEEPHKGKIAGHVGSCVQCRRFVDELSRGSHFLQGDSLEPPQGADQLYDRVMSRARTRDLRSVWQRRIPWPLAAAAAAVLVAGASLWNPAVGRGGAVPFLASQKEDLSAMDNLVPIMLPPEQKFAVYGDSQLLKAAGFDRGEP